MKVTMCHYPYGTTLSQISLGFAFTFSMQMETARATQAAHMQLQVRQTITDWPKHQSVKTPFLRFCKSAPGQSTPGTGWPFPILPCHLFSQLPSWCAAGFTSIGPTVNLGKTSRKVLSVDDHSEGWILSENLLPLNKKADRWGGIWTHRGSHFSKIGFTLSRFQEASKDWLIPTLIELIHYQTAHSSVLHWFTPHLILHRNMFYDNDNVLL